MSWSVSTFLESRALYLTAHCTSLVTCNQYYTSHPLEQIPISSTQTTLFFRFPPGLTKFYSSKRLSQENQIIPNQILSPNLTHLWILLTFKIYLECGHLLSFYHCQSCFYNLFTVSLGSNSFLTLYMQQLTKIHPCKTSHRYTSLLNFSEAFQLIQPNVKLIEVFYKANKHLVTKELMESSHNCQ